MSSERKYQFKKALEETLNEYHLLYKDKEEWDKMRESVISALNTGFDEIEHDNYDEGRQYLKFVIDTLRKWDEQLDFAHASEEGGLGQFHARHPYSKSS